MVRVVDLRDHEDLSSLHTSVSERAANGLLVLVHAGRVDEAIPAAQSLEGRSVRIGRAHHVQAEAQPRDLQPSTQGQSGPARQARRPARGHLHVPLVGLLDVLEAVLGPEGESFRARHQGAVDAERGELSLLHRAERRAGQVDGQREVGGGLAQDEDGLAAGEVSACDHPAVHNGQPRAVTDRRTVACTELPLEELAAPSQVHDSFTSGP
mmetsp:Transcript_45487/g.134636  ORF Transcript_45487/g.134636 Transcript_45487/m.134636 type:complete len:210 (-) Transcript_45487:40-669(-)